MIKTVKTKYGILEGVESNAGYALFRGVPYAKPPIGDLRWKYPQDPEPWEGVRVCDTYGDACAQYDRWATAIGDVEDDYGHSYVHMPNYPYPPKMSEDCLYLNIYTPAERGDEKLPVMVYIHGGGCQQWYGSDYEYCGDGFCREGCILVSITYRLNIFGYFVHPELAAESGHDASGNYGLMDQIQAVKWVHENIEGFGGDPNNILVFGQSAGARSSLAVACSPHTGDWVKHISIQSGGGIGRVMGGGDRQANEKKGLEVMEYLGCKNIAEMRALPWETLRDANDKLFGMMRGFNIYTDGYVLPEDIDQMVIGGKLRDIDIVIGNTVDEGANNKPARFGGNMCASVRLFAKAMLKNGKKPVYAYVFDRPQPGDDVGTPHSCDNRYQFGSLDGTWRPYEQCDWDLSVKMQKYWANFARTGNPNGEGVEEWKPFEADGLHLRLAVDGCTMVDYDAELGGKLTEIENEVKKSLGIE